MGLIKNLWRGFKGGPDFSNCIEVTAQLENWQLNLTLPVTNIVTAKAIKKVNYPFNQSGWFEANSKQRLQHHYVHIETKLWYYLPMAIFYQGEIGVLSLSTQLKRIPAERKVNAKDLDALGHYVITEYDEYYNAPLDSSGGGGENTRWIKHFEDEIRSAFEGYFSEEEIQEKLAQTIPPVPQPPMEPHEIKTINNRDWVFCAEFQERGHTHDNMYCHPLSEDYYLCLNFRHRVDDSSKYKHWKEHANAAEKRVMEMVRLEKVETTALPEETQLLLE
ncbi:hypothetical protein [Aliikangiella sp. IMCC44359]|uniref:hypothetical protein n=1 Tax=Aliikangiella sp. IMCC44359 TaxID=3459125 RepID=UPI00403AE497